MNTLPDNIKFCIGCREELNDKNWYPSSKIRRDYRCKSCQKNKGKIYYSEHRNDMLKKSLKSQKIRKIKLKFEIISHYSNNKMECMKCGFKDMRALSIDHIHGGGRKHRKQLGIISNFYEWLKKNNYPEGYQVLCMNCQFIKRLENKECEK